MGRGTKEAIIEAAISLFNAKGFTGTSTRDIANKANVNVSNISYYFQNKRGLLEYCFTTFFEEYLKKIEEAYNTRDGSLGRLKRVTESILIFQCKNIHLTRLVLREISIDSQVVREIMSTYYVKERYFFKRIFEEGIRSKEFHSFSIDYMIIQYKSLLTMPFLNTYYLTEVLHIFPNESYFAKRYMKEINNWIDGIICNNQKNPLPMVIT